MIAVDGVLERKLEDLGTSLALVLPGGRRIGRGRRARHAAPERPRPARRASPPARSARSAQDYVEGRVDFDGSMRDLMARRRRADRRRPDARPAPRRRSAGGATLPHRADARARATAAHRRAPDPVPLRRLGRLLRALARSAARLFVRLLPRPGDDAGAGAGGQARPHLPQADAARGRALPRHRRRLGRPAAVGRRALRRARPRHHAQSKNQHAYVNRADRRARPAAAACDGAARLPRARRKTSPTTRSPRSACSSTSASANLPTYFAKIRRLLKPGGLLMNHGITAGGTRNRQLGAGLGDFIERYIFPGGELLHVSPRAARHGRRRASSRSTSRTCGRTTRARCGPGRDALEARLGRGAQAHARARRARLPALPRRQRDVLRAAAGSSLHQMLARAADRRLDDGADARRTIALPVQPRLHLRAALTR